jgi:hypothetical protein
LDEKDYIMKCIKCNLDSPENVVAINKEWVCPFCEIPKKLVTEALEEKYHSMGPYKLLYVSDFSNNLFKVEQHFHENTLMDNPFSSITLTQYPGLGMLKSKYDIIYADKEVATVNELTPFLDDGGEIVWVKPTTMEIET